MRTLLLALTLIASPALAHDIGRHHEHALYEGMEYFEEFKKINPYTVDSYDEAYAILRSDMVYACNFGTSRDGKPVSGEERMTSCWNAAVAEEYMAKHPEEIPVPTAEEEAADLAIHQSEASRGPCTTGENLTEKERAEQCRIFNEATAELAKAGHFFLPETVPVPMHADGDAIDTASHMRDAYVYPCTEGRPFPGGPELSKEEHREACILFFEANQVLVKAGRVDGLEFFATNPVPTPRPTDR